LHRAIRDKDDLIIAVYNPSTDKINLGVLLTIMSVTDKDVRSKVFTRAGLSPDNNPGFDEGGSGSGTWVSMETALEAFVGDSAVPSWGSDVIAMAMEDAKQRVKELEMQKDNPRPWTFPRMGRPRYAAESASSPPLIRTPIPPPRPSSSATPAETSASASARPGPSNGSGAPTREEGPEQT
jgi:hypothetical protein